MESNTVLKNTFIFLEGIVQKRAESGYQINKRSQDWLKVIDNRQKRRQKIG